MADANPYTAPKAKVAGASDGAVGEIRFFTSEGRIGRLRYLAYTTALNLLLGLVIIAMGALLGPQAESGLALAIMAIAYLAVLVMAVLFTIQRSHDMDKSGWLALLMIVPLVNFIFLLMSGTDGENRFGPKPPPNGKGVVLIALAFPILAIVGIVAAIALPAYQDYVKRANVQQTK